MSRAPDPRQADALEMLRSGLLPAEVARRLATAEAPLTERSVSGWARAAGLSRPRGRKQPLSDRSHEILSAVLDCVGLDGVISRGRIAEVADLYGLSRQRVNDLVREFSPTGMYDL